ncbi:MAG TPA: SoxR reducing system RseC family protein [Cellvibrio sp.]|nr:SoxR reducing system RseC family protein [Cellvibrio sp.]
MILETGRVMAIEPKGLWVETIQLSACGSCRAQKGCGHSALAKIGTSASQLWVLLDGRNPESYRLGDEVCIGVPEAVVAGGAMFIYMVPLLTMLVATFTAYQQSASDSMSALAALAGLLLGGAIVRLRAHQTRFDTRLQPVLVDHRKTLLATDVCAVE